MTDMKYTDFLRVGQVLEDFGEVLVKTYREKLADSTASGLAGSHGEVQRETWERIP